MRLLTSIIALRCYLTQRRLKANCVVDKPITWDKTGLPTTIGLVPTMGALHRGHLSLIHRARDENHTVVVSIFVNPLQFGPDEDYHSYPRILEQDYQFCKQAGVDAVFVPSSKEMGISLNNSAESSIIQVIPPHIMTSVLCGRSRPSHFQGVATIVIKLFNLVQPERVYFGEKDGQQLAIIKKLVTDLNLPVEVIACPTVREISGLALSSRNNYLTEDQMQQANGLYRALTKAKEGFGSGLRHSRLLIALVRKELAQISSLSVEYIELVEPNTLIPIEIVENEGMLAIAAHMGGTRLIDNIILRDRQPIIAIDGPAGSGKSTVAYQVAAKLKLVYLDTGAMYRAVTWLVLERGIKVDDECAIAELVSHCCVELTPSKDPLCSVMVRINGNNLNKEIRSVEVTSNVSAIASHKSVRQALVKQQQTWGQKGGLVAEGRDIGTHVFPDAEVKIFLNASIGERARRRQQDFQRQGQPEVSLEQLEKYIAERDWKDSNREVSPLQKASNAIEINTDGLSVSQVTEIIIQKSQHLISES